MLRYGGYFYASLRRRSGETAAEALSIRNALSVARAFHPVCFRLQVAGHAQPPFPDRRAAGALGELAIPGRESPQLIRIAHVGLGRRRDCEWGGSVHLGARLRATGDRVKQSRSGA